MFGERQREESLRGRRGDVVREPLDARVPRDLDPLGAQGLAQRVRREQRLLVDPHAAADDPPARDLSTDGAYV